MFYEEFKSLCRKTWKELLVNYLILNRLGKNESTYKRCNESKNWYKNDNPQKETF